MTNEEKARELAGFEEGINPVPTQRFVFDKCLEMAAWKEQQFINWLENLSIVDYANCVKPYEKIIEFDIEKLIEDFKKVMKGE